jgi:hypothetical protein
MHGINETAKDSQFVSTTLKVLLNIIRAVMALHNYHLKLDQSIITNLPDTAIFALLRLCTEFRIKSL